jgi:leucyl aminopeptidase
MTMHSSFAAGGDAVPIHFVHTGSIGDVLRVLSEHERSFVAAARYEPKPGRLLLVPGESGTLAGVLFGLETPDAKTKDLFRPGQLATALPPGTYCFAATPHDARLAALAFALGSYQFTRYRKADPREARLVVPEAVDAVDLSRIADAVALARDLINMPSNDMGPGELEAAARSLAGRYAAHIRVIQGTELEKDFPLIHAVGMGSPRAPRLIDLTWGEPRAPRITLVGKGVCFDTGGLDIKPESAMLNMKKDMGGAATALALAQMVMDRGLPIRLRVLVPAVENAISGASFRPRDVFTSRKGVTVEIGNTDAEGRLVLADALALADEEKPQLLVDFATLTGAARVALGPDVPPFFTDDDSLAADLMRAGLAEQDPLWRLPLWSPYEAMLESKVADTNNVGSGGQAGAITAALFLKKFVSAPSWLHLDVFAWTPSARPGRPEGGELQSARALYAILKERYG